MNNPDSVTTLEVAILLTLLGENIAKTEYYERVNPMIRLKDGDMEHSVRLIELRRKLKNLVPPDKIVDFIKYNPHLNELWPDIKLDDVMAKQMEEDSEEFAQLEQS